VLVFSIFVGIFQISSVFSYRTININIATSVLV